MADEGMNADLGWASRARVLVGRRAIRWMLRSKRVRRRLLAERAIDVEERGLDPDTAVVLAVEARTHDSELWRLSPAKARVRMAEGIAIADDPVPRPIDARDVTLGGVGARVYVPAGLASPSPAVFFIHGGGWVTGDLDTHDTLCRRIAAEGDLRVVAVDYRRAPEHPFPAAADDVLAAFRAFAASARELGVDPARVAVAGDSAGGNLSAVVSLDTRGDEVRPALQVLLYPSVDVTWSTGSRVALSHGYYLTDEAIEWYVTSYAGARSGRGSGREDPRVSPLRAAEVRGAPPAIVAVAGFDPLRDEGEAYAARLRDAGVSVDLRVYASLVHGFALMTGVSRAARDATYELATSIARALHQGP